MPIFGASTIILAAGCASPPETTTAATSKGTCQREYRIGSNIPVIDCSKAPSEAERQMMIDQLRDKPKPLPGGVKTGG